MSIERAALEAEVKHLREQLAAYEAEPVAAYISMDRLFYWPDQLKSGAVCERVGDYSVIRKPTSTAHLEAIKAQVWNEAIEEAARIAEHIAQNGLGGAPTCVRAIRSAKKG